jgi:hypothetical protein
VAHLTTYLNLESCEILRSGFNFKLNLTSAIGDLANRGFLASYVSCQKAMVFDMVTEAVTHKIGVLQHSLSRGNLMLPAHEILP